MNNYFKISFWFILSVFILYSCHTGELKNEHIIRNLNQGAIRPLKQINFIGQWYGEGKRENNYCLEVMEGEMTADEAYDLIKSNFKDKIGY